jgi:hypothetical protein
MTAADLATVAYLDDLPALASHPLVKVQFVAALELGTCAICPDLSDEEPKQACFRILYAQWNHANLPTDACSPEHADEELTWLLRERPEETSRPTNIRLLVPQKLVNLPSGPRNPPRTPADLVASEGDEMFLAVDALLRYVQTLPDPGDVEAFRRKVVAAVASLGLARIEQLGGRTA